MQEVVPPGIHLDPLKGYEMKQNKFIERRR
jgi:hypothetical protein